MESNKYIYIRDLNHIGKIDLSYSSGYVTHRESCLLPALEVKNENRSDFILYPGFLTVDNKFFQCPFSIFYVQLNFIKSYLKNNRQYIEASITVFSKDYLSNIEIPIYQESHWIGSGVVNPSLIMEIINSINIYIEYGNEIELLNEELFKTKFQINLLERHEIIRIINILKFKYFSNDLSRREDNRYWKEVEIHNLPQNLYFTEIFLELLKKSSVFDRVEYSNDVIKITYDSENIYGPTFGRQVIDENTSMSNQIKDILKFGIKESVDLVKEKNDRMKKI